MALAYSKVRRGVDVFGKRVVECDVTFDNSYPTGGEPVDIKSLAGLTQVERVELVFEAMPDHTASSFTTHGRQVVPDVSSKTAPKLKVYSSNNTEASNASDQSQIVQRVRFIGH